MITIVDYGVGNLQNIQNALQYCGEDSKIISTPQDLLQAEKVILPGVGSFGYCVQKIQEKKFATALREVANRKIPLLGICVGMQLFFETSEEKGTHQGLGILKGEVKKLESQYKVPHIGWNKVCFSKQNLDCWFYFVHSYHVFPVEKEIVAAYCDYGCPVVSVVKKGNIWGTQFHPEKSQEDGLNFLRQFIQL